jgi:nucleoside-diphosphate-sugar epimerase
VKVILFGATGMVGQGVLRECLRDDGVDVVLAVGRSSTGQTHPKLRELIRKDLFDFGAAGADLQGYDACFFCLGVSSAGMSEADYTHLTYDLTLGWAQALARANPALTFVYVSGAGTGGKAFLQREARRVLVKTTFRISAIGLAKANCGLAALAVTLSQ